MVDSLKPTPESVRKALYALGTAMAFSGIERINLLARQDTFRTDGAIEIVYTSGETVKRRINLGVEDQELFDQAPRA